MTRQIRAELIEPGDEVSREDSRIADDNEQIEEDILTEIGEASNDAVYLMRAYQVDGQARGAKETFLFEADSAQISNLHTKLLNEYGTGLYRIRIWKNNVLWKKNDIRVKAPLKVESAKKENSEMLTLMQEMMRQQASTNAQFIAELKSAAQTSIVQPSVDPFQMLERMSTVMKNMGMVGAAPVSPGMDLSSVVDIFGKVKDMVGDMAPQAAGERGLLDVAIEFMKSGAIEKIIEGLGQRAQMPARPNVYQPPQRLRPPQQAQTPNNPQPQGQTLRGRHKVIIPNVGLIDAPPPHMTGGEQVGTDGRQRQNFINPQEANQSTGIDPRLKTLIAELLMAAKRNHDPELYAELIWNQPDVTEDVLEAIVGTPNLIGILAGLEPEVNNHRLWFERTLASLTTIVKEENEKHGPNAVNPASANTTGIENGEPAGN